MRTRKLLALLVLLPTVAIAGQDTFPEALQEHLLAIKTRDWAAFEKTLTSGEQLTFVAPNGKTSTTTQAFKSAMKSWLADTDWSWQLEQIGLTSTANTGIAVYSVRYSDKDQHGKPYEMKYVLSLVFALEAEGWKLVHDQNTLLAH
ncbi:nuclear transport factor 2 family protein [Chitinimonas sp. BJYL2]|uniref:YybH family protein n=1 Tax=Chitinimonas sp. BJYL2 TaxID=2976696 RepID=UPI0022B3A74C|nr:nuclear transport factor 2 family protein [Chitinimonas sp. BJYL2]